MQKNKVTTEDVELTRRRASSTKAQVERMPTAPAPPQASPHSLPTFYF